MSELRLICKQPDPHAYKQTTVERPDIPNHLAREFAVNRPDQVWCDDITYIWSGQRWNYLAVALDLFARRAVGWAMSAYFRSAGEVEARAVESTYRNPALKSVFPHERYDVPVEQQIVSYISAVALKLGPNAMGADVTSMRHAAEIAADKALGVKEAADFVYLALTGTSQSPEADALRARCALLADDINPKLKEHRLDDWGYRAPEIRPESP